MNIAIYDSDGWTNDIVAEMFMIMMADMIIMVIILRRSVRTTSEWSRRRRSPECSSVEPMHSNPDVDTTSTRWSSSPISPSSLSSSPSPTSSSSSSSPCLRKCHCWKHTFDDHNQDDQYDQDHGDDDNPDNDQKQNEDDYDGHNKDDAHGGIIFWWKWGIWIGKRELLESVASALWTERERVK